MHSSASWMTSVLPWITCSTLATMPANPWANAAVGSTVCLDISSTIRCRPMTLALALDIGGTKVASALVGGDGVVRSATRGEIATPTGADAEALWAAVAELVGEVAA